MLCIIRKPAVSAFFILFIISKAFAATYYVDGSAASDSGSGSRVNPKKYIKSGIALMSGGDTLIIKDGVYTGINNMMCSASNWEWNGIPNGTAQNYTTIKAENYLGAVLDGRNTWNPIFLTGRSYLKIENLHVKNSSPNNGGSNVVILESDHIKIIKCASEEAYFWHFRYSRCKYTLTEDCFAWGRGAYSFVVKGDGDWTASQYNIFRRCLARRDAHYFTSGGNHWASFVAYMADNTYFQNCVSIDGHYIYAGEPDPPGFTKAAWFTANGASNFNVLGSLSINDEGMIGMFEAGATPVTFKNNSCILSLNGGEQGIYHRDGNQVVIENNILARGATGTAGGIQEAGTAVLRSAKNNIIYYNYRGLVDIQSGNHSYNVLYKNSDGNHWGTRAGIKETTSRNPLTNGLKYPVRIESGSFLSTAGEGGGGTGPEILKKIGVSGTLYGEAGWDTVTNENLWPFPNEDVIRQKMMAYNLHGANGARGFCASGATLTKYIWEYLGNTIPPEIYGSAFNESGPAGKNKPSSSHTIKQEGGFIEWLKSFLRI